MKKFLLAIETSLILILGLSFNFALADTTTTPATYVCVNHSGSQCNLTITNGDYIQSGGGDRAGLHYDIPSGLGTINSITLHTSLVNVFGLSDSANVDKTATNVTTGFTTCSSSGSLGTINIPVGQTGPPFYDGTLDITAGGYTSGQSFDLCITGNSSGTWHEAYLGHEYLDIDYTPGGGGGGSTTTWTSFGLWGTIATGTQALITESGMPFWEIALGVLFALFCIFFLTVGLSKSMKALLKGR